MSMAAKQAFNDSPARGRAVENTVPVSAADVLAFVPLVLRAEARADLLAVAIHVNGNGTLVAYCDDEIGGYWGALDGTWRPDGEGTLLEIGRQRPQRATFHRRAGRLGAAVGSLGRFDVLTTPKAVLAPSTMSLVDIAAVAR